jgi:sulfite exporter TauE/SafE
MRLYYGLAGSATLILVTLGSVNNVWEGASYILVSGVGTILSMVFFNTKIGIPFVISNNKMNINKLLIQFAGVISTAFGIYYMYNLGVTEGLFKLWI